MRILVATGIYPPQIGGPATYSKLLYDELPKRDIDVEIVSFGDFIDKPKFIRHFLYFKAVLKKSSDVSVIYAQDPVSVGLPALIASQIMRKKFILKIVGDYAWEQGTQRFGVKDTLDDFSKKMKPYVWQVKILKMIEKYVADCAHAIVTPSFYLKGIISNWGVDGSKIKVIYNGMRLPDTKVTKTILRKRLGLNGFIIVSVARLVPWKGFPALIDAFNEVKKVVPTASLVIAGDGPDEAQLKAKAESMGISQDVRFTGRLEQKALFDHIRASDAFVLNTSYEGFSHLIIETMALGTPIITTSVGGNVEAIKDKETGFLIPPNNVDLMKEKILTLIREPETALHFAKKAREKSKSFTDVRMLDEVASFLKSQ